MTILAHPDDETLGLGGCLALYAAEGVLTSVLTATRGERGWRGPAESYPGLAAVGAIREAELRAAAATLGVHDLALLDYVDGDLDQADPDEAARLIVGHLRRFRPQVVATFGHDGAYGHPDHIAICQLTTAAVMASADPAFVAPGDYPPHRVSKLYYMVDSQGDIEPWDNIFGGLSLPVDGVARTIHAWPDWAITTRLDTSAYWRQVLAAAYCHQSQLADLTFLPELSENEVAILFGHRSFIRAASLVNGGRAVETDLFAGLR
jgi:LmbE family N-acetylglucosaminyl deacetylase